MPPVLIYDRERLASSLNAEIRRVPLAQRPTVADIADGLRGKDALGMLLHLRNAAYAIDRSTCNHDERPMEGACSSGISRKAPAGGVLRNTA